METKKQIEARARDWKTKHENLVIQKEISDFAYKEEISSLKKELAEKDKKIDFLYDVIKKLDAKVDALAHQVSELTKENAMLKEIIATQNDQIQKLKSRLNKDSNNSSKPPSTNGYKKVVQNNRDKTGNKIGGQFGHKGNYLKYFSNPTEIIEKKVLVCDQCKGEVESSEEYTFKQLADIEIHLSVKEERVFSGVCINCGKPHTGVFSEEYVNPVQYGNNLKSLITLLNSHGFVSINKTTEILKSITDHQINISDATVVNIQKSFSDLLEDTISSIKSNLIKCKVLHGDETGCRVNAKTNWVQVFSNNMFTLCGYDEKRGTASIEGMGILDYFVGILVHDHFSSYYKNTMATHSECNAHILRYLKSIIEIFKHSWAKEMIEHLVDCLNRKKIYIANDEKAFTYQELEEISEKYIDILRKGQLEYEEAIKGKKRIDYYNDERLLLKRLEEYKEEHLRFVSNFYAPFDNNQAERDLRPLKTKTKVSGCFRSKEGIKAFLNIYSLISTLKKQNMNVYSSIRDIFYGKKFVFE